jgi:chlorophyll synthase
MAVPAPSAIAELLKPITWFPPMWAFGCGVVASGLPLEGRLLLVACGVLLAGPLVCATSQAVNDWFDRHVDAINEPQRPIPSGRMPGRWGLYVALGWTALSLLVALALGPWGFASAVLGLILAWAYSAPPLRLKQNGWWGNAACGLCYEGLAWVTGAAVMAGGAMPNLASLTLAGLYSFGAHGIMTLNDFKSIEGDQQMGVGSLPVRLGVQGAAWAACLTMAAPQAVVVGLLLLWHQPGHAAGVLGLLLVQMVMMRRFLSDPRRLAIWYSSLGVTLFVAGMLVSAFALRSLDLSRLGGLG